MGHDFVYLQFPGLMRHFVSQPGLFLGSSHQDLGRISNISYSRPPSSSVRPPCARLTVAPIHDGHFSRLNCFHNFDNCSLTSFRCCSNLANSSCCFGLFFPRAKRSSRNDCSIATCPALSSPSMSCSSLIIRFVSSGESSASVASTGSGPEAFSTSCSVPAAASSFLDGPVAGSSPEALFESCEPVPVVPMSAAKASPLGGTGRAFGFLGCEGGGISGGDDSAASCFFTGSSLSVVCSGAAARSSPLKRPRDSSSRILVSLVATSLEGVMIVFVPVGRGPSTRGLTMSGDRVTDPRTGPFCPRRRTLIFLGVLGIVRGGSQIHFMVLHNFLMLPHDLSTRPPGTWAVDCLNCVSKIAC